MKIINNLVPGVWPLVIIICVIVISLRLSYLKIKKIKFNIYEELFNLVFIIYILCLFHIVTYQDVNYGVNNFIPFINVNNDRLFKFPVELDVVFSIKLDPLRCEAVQ